MESRTGASPGGERGWNLLSEARYRHELSCLCFPVWEDIKDERLPYKDEHLADVQC